MLLHDAAWLCKKMTFQDIWDGTRGCGMTTKTTTPKSQPLANPRPLKLLMACNSEAPHAFLIQLKKLVKLVNRLSDRATEILRALTR